MCVCGSTWESDSRLDQVERPKRLKNRPKTVGNVGRHESDFTNGNGDKEDLADTLEGLQGRQQEHLGHVE